jgi:DNA mismatch repair protein MutH
MRAILTPSDLRNATDSRDLLAHARTLVSYSVAEIRHANRLAGMSESAARVGHKGRVGRIVEEYFGFRHQDNNPEPDFPKCGTELKTLPMLQTREGYRVKERTVISMIDFTALQAESWQSSSVRRKLGRILFVFVKWNPADPDESTVLAAEEWEPDETDLAFFEADWRYAWRMVCCGQADMISEADALYLAPCRKGAGKGKDLRRQPNSPIRAKSRAFSLKPSFTTQTFKEIVEGKRFQSIVKDYLPDVKLRGFRELERRLTESVRPLIGENLGAIGAKLSLDLSGGKDRAARIVRRLLGALDVASEVREFMLAGSQIKTLSLREGTGSAYEAVSFPATNLDRLLTDSWEDSQLCQDLGRVLFVPTYRPDRKTPPALRTLGLPFFWTPTTEQWVIIQREWADYKRQVAEGLARYEVVPGRSRRRSLLKHESETEIIHMRPHGSNASDTVLNPQGEPVTRQCFWLNAVFVAQLAAEHSGDFS